MESLVLTNAKGLDITTSLIVAEVFEKRHDNVLADVKNLSCSDQFRLLNFQESIYINVQGREMPMYEITKDGFCFLAMGYTGEKAAHFKEKFINEFNRREALLSSDDYIISRATQILTKRAEELNKQLRENKRQLRIVSPSSKYIVDAEFAEWANEYFAVNGANVNTLLVRNVVFNHCAKKLKKKNLTSCMFFKKLQAYCAECEHIKQINPIEFANSSGRIIRKVDFKTMEMIYVQTL